MSFRGQVRRAFLIGLALGAAGLFAGLVAVVLETLGQRVVADMLASLSMVLIAVGGLVGLGGGIARPAQRWAFRHGMPSGRLRGFALRQPALRWWLWVDEAGQTRDD